MTSRVGSTGEGLKILSGLKVEGRVQPPPSKSLTQRAFNLALLAGSQIEIIDPLRSEDTDRYLEALGILGLGSQETKKGILLRPQPAKEEAPIFCGHNGTMLRFLTAALTTLAGEWTLDGSQRLRQRPIGPLVDALRTLGAKIKYVDREGFAPVTISGRSLSGGVVKVDASQSSQYVSALVMAATQAEAEVVVQIENLVSGPYLDLTREVMRSFGATSKVEPQSHTVSVFPSSLGCSAFEIEADFSAASYPAAAAVLTGGKVFLEGVGRNSLQGDRRFLDVLSSMGSEIDWHDEGVWVSSGRELLGVEVDMSDIPDQVPTLAAMAPFAKGRTVIANVRHLRIKESDRLAAMVSELSKLGAKIREREDGLEVEGTWAESQEIPETETRVDTHGDHRVAMSLAICALVRPGVTIESPEVVAKSYPSFWDDLESLLKA